MIKIKNIIQLVIHLLSILILLIISQVGVIWYLISMILFKKIHQRIICFLSCWVLGIFLIIPICAKPFGRVPIYGKSIKAQSLVSIIFYRNYVKKNLNEVLQSISRKYQQRYPNLQIHYLDACFPFFDGYPLLPHLSHDDGKKIDLVFIYQDDHGLPFQPLLTTTGYGAATPVKPGEPDQPKLCIERGYWQYHAAQYLTLGKWRETPALHQQATAELIRLFVEHPQVQKVFLEPHLVARMQLRHPRMRYHGCHSVSHDDHFHVQIH